MYGLGFALVQWPAHQTPSPVRIPGADKLRCHCGCIVPPRPTAGGTGESEFSPIPERLRTGENVCVFEARRCAPALEGGTGFP